MKIAYDIKLMRPGCVLVQVGLNADREAAMAFDTRDWLTTITPDMKVYPINEDQLVQLIQMTEKARQSPT